MTFVRLVAPKWENTIRVRKGIGKGKQRTSQGERKTVNVTFCINNTNEITGHELGKCDMTSNRQGRQLESCLEGIT